MKKFLVMAAIAMSAFLTASAQDDTSEALTDKLYPQIMQASQSNDHAQAKALIEQLIDAGADISELEATYAYALAATGELQKGIDRLNAYLDGNNTDYLAYQALGDLWGQAGDEAKAFAAYNMCIHINPTFARPYVSFARLVKNKNKKLAMTGYNKAISLFLEAGQPNGAVQLGGEAMEVDPDNTKLLILLGDALVMANMPKNALAFYNEAMLKSISNGSHDYETTTKANCKMAGVLYELGEYDSALKLLDTLIESEETTAAYKSDFAKALNLAASCWEKKGDEAKATQYRERANAFSAE